MTTTSSITIRSAFPRITLRKGGKEEAWAAQTNGQNGALSIWFWSDIEERVGTGAQEYFEWVWRNKVGAAAALPAVLLAIALSILASLPLGLAAGIVFLAAVVAFLFVPELHPIQRRKELFSHAITALCYVQFDRGAKALSAYIREDVGDPAAPEKGGMLGLPGYAWIHGMARDEVERRIVANIPKAQRWIEAHRAMLERMRDAKL